MGALFGDITFWAFVALVIFLGILIRMNVPGMIAGALDQRALDRRQIQIGQALIECDHKVAQRIDQGAVEVEHRQHRALGGEGWGVGGRACRRV